MDVMPNHQTFFFLTFAEKFKEQLTSFAIMNVPAMLPEILTTPSGPFFIVQNIRDSYLLSALHSYSDTLSVNSNPLKNRLTIRNGIFI